MLPLVLMASVVVIGGGLAGLSAALAAASHGAQVLLIEKVRSVGGNSAKATSGVNACCTDAQSAAGVRDGITAFFHDTMESGQQYSDSTLARVLTTQSRDALGFLASFGVALDGVVQCGGHGLARTHFERPREDGKPRPVGWDIISALRAGVERTPGITVLTGCRVVELLQKTDGSTTDTPHGTCAVVGVKMLCADADAAAAAEAAGATAPAPSLPLVLQRQADAVVLATGGFGADHSATSLLMEYAPGIASLPTTNGVFATGDGVKLARLAGAHLRGMEFVQVHPTGFVDPADPSNRTKFLAPEALRGFGGIMLNSRGRRFVDELGRRDVVTHEMYKWCSVPGPSGQGGPFPRPAAVPRPVVAFLVLTAAAVVRFGPNFGFYEKKVRVGVD